VDIELVITEIESGSSQRFAGVVTDRLLLGRDVSSPVQLRGPKISREHFELLNKDRRILLRDLSANGTWVNGERARKGSARRIRSSDLIEIPGYRLEVEFSNQGLGSAAPPVEQPVINAPSPQSSSPNPVYALIRSFGFLESLVLVGAVCSLGVVLLYLAS
jgi:predicted component of type VI protein secretion system